ncbi:hypothetical protein THAOC_21518, partial [Thalassiosira oceanica]
RCPSSTSCAPSGWRRRCPSSTSRGGGGSTSRGGGSRRRPAASAACGDAAAAAVDDVRRRGEPSFLSALVSAASPRQKQPKRESLLVEPRPATTRLATELAFGPFLEAIEDKIPILKARSAEDYILLVAQAFLAVGSPGPWHDDSRKTSYRLSKMISAWKKEDPPPNRVKPIPVQVLRSIAYLARDSNRDFNKATMDMIMIAFYFMLRPGEYTVDCGRVRRGVNALSKMVSTAKSSASDAAVMPSSASPQSLCLRANNADPTALLATVCTTPRKVMHSVFSVTDTLRETVCSIGLSLGFLPDNVSVRSLLRAAGANALLATIFANVDTQTSFTSSGDGARTKCCATFTYTFKPRPSWPTIRNA